MCRSSFGSLFSLLRSVDNLEFAFEDEGVDELEDGLLVVGVEVLELAEALEEPLAV